MKNKILSTLLIAEQTAIFYLGQESILIKHADKYILFDGYLSDYVDRNCCSELVKWVRRYPAPIAPEELDFVDLVFCSHDHYDHADPDTLSAIARVNSKAKYIVPAPIADTVACYGVPKDSIIPAYADKEISVCGFTVLPVPAAHEELSPNENGEYSALGFRVDLGGTVIFHAGDCCVYDGLAERLGRVNVMCLPVNGRSYYKRYVQDIIGNMNACEAAELCKVVGADLLVPMHFDLYDVNCVTTSTVVDGIESTASRLCYHIFKPGERYIYQA